MANDSVGNIALDLGINYNQFNKELGSIAGNATNMVGSAFKKLGTIVAGAFAVKSIIDFGKESIGLASDLSEVQNVVDVTFGSMAADINDWSKTALQSFGLSELSAKRYSSTLGAMMKSSGLAGIQMESMSKDLTGLAGDMASFYNLSTDMAFDKIRSGISGETEPLKQLGINMSVANMEAFALTQGIKKQYQQMNQAEQTLLRYNYLLSVTKDAQGDFARTSGSWANQVRLLQEQWNSFKATLGSAFITLLTPVLQLLNTLIAKLQIAAEYFKAFVNMLMGVSDSAQGTTGSVDGLGVSVDDTANAVKKANKTVKNSLAGFDELNLLTKSTADSLDNIGSGLNIGGTATTIDTAGLNSFKVQLDEVKTKLGEVWAKLQETFGPPLSKLFNTARTVSSNIFDGLKTSAQMVAGTLSNTLKPIVIWFNEKGFPMMTEVTGDVITGFGDLFTAGNNAFNTLWKDVISPFLERYGKEVTSTLNEVYNAWNLNKGSINEILSSLFRDIKTGWADFWKEFSPTLKTELGKMYNSFDGSFADIIKSSSELLSELLKLAIRIKKEVTDPIVNELQKIFTPAIKTAFKSVSEAFNLYFNDMMDIVKSYIKVLNNLLDFINNVFSGNWEKAWGSVKSIFKIMIDNFVGSWKSAINIVIDYINWFLGQMYKKINFKLPSWMPDFLGENFMDPPEKIPHLAKGGLVSAPTLAMVGDNRNAAADPEVVSPLSKLQEMLGGSNQEVVNALMVIADLLKNVNFNPVLKVGEVEFGRVAATAINTASRRDGRTLITT